LPTKVTASLFDFLTTPEFQMTKNIGNIERIIRIVGGLVLIALAATGTVGVWGWLGLVPLATGLTGWCPPYSLLGINTCKNKNT
jgi:O-antigen ligase